MSLYRADHKTARWYKRLFYHFAIDVTLANAFLLYRTKHPDTTLFDYKLSVATSLLAGLGRAKEAAEAQVNAGLLLGPSASNITMFGEAGDPMTGMGATGHRLDGVGHYADFVANVPKCCAKAGCTKRSKVWCVKCRRYLCLRKGRNCFWDYHHNKT